MVFKRPRGGAVADEDRARRAAAEARQAAIESEHAALFEKLKLRDMEMAKQKAEAERALLDATRAQKLASDQAAREQEAKARDLIDQARKQEAVVQQERATAEKALRSAADKAQVDRARQQDLDAMRAKNEDVIRQLQAELKAKSGGPAKKPEPQASASDPFGSKAGRSGPNDPITAVVKLQHMDGNTAAKVLAKVFPQAKIVAETRPDSITLTGPAKVVMEAREILQAKLDVPADGATTKDNNAEFVSIGLKNAKADEVVKVLTDIFRGTMVRIRPISGNQILVFASPAHLADVKKVIAELDRAGPAK
jgi:hypothetical protein